MEFYCPWNTTAVVTCARYWILTKLRLYSLEDPGLWTLSSVTWSCLLFPFELVPSTTSLAWRLTPCSLSIKTIYAWYCCSCLSELVLCGWWSGYLSTPLCYFVAIMHVFSSPIDFSINGLCTGVCYKCPHDNEPQHRTKLQQIDRFGDANWVNSRILNSTTLRYSERFDHQFSHVFMFGNMFPESQGSVASSNNFKL